jgi:hypothetical protein
MPLGYALLVTGALLALLQRPSRPR